MSEDFLRQYRRALYKEQEDDRFKEDITSSFVKFLNRDKIGTKNSFIVWVLGGRGAGKTGLAFIMLNQLDKRRKVQFFRTPPRLIETIEQFCPQEQKGRFEAIDKLRKVSPESIFVFDEGLISANAKEALKVENRDLGKFLSKSRHSNNIGIINSVNLNILSEFRDMIDIIIYKRCTRFFIKNNENRESFLKEHRDTLIRMKEGEGLFVSDYKRFEKIGQLSISLEYCPWFNDKISRYQYGTSADVTYDERLRRQEKHKDVAQRIADRKGKLFCKRGGYDEFISWLYIYKIDLYYDYRSDLNLLFKLYKHYAHEDDEVKVREVSEDDAEEPQEQEPFNIIIDLFEEKFYYEYKKAEVFELIKREKTRWQNVDRDIEIYNLRKEEDYLLEELVDAYEGLNTPGAITRIYNKLDGAFKYYKGKLFEQKVKKFLTAELERDRYQIDAAGGSGEFDMRIEDLVLNDLYFLSLKSEEIETLVKTYKADELRPEFREAYNAKFEGYEDVFMLLIVFNTHTNRFTIQNVDFTKPHNVKTDFR